MLKKPQENQKPEQKYAERTSKVISSQTQEQLDEVRESFQWRKIRKKKLQRKQRVLGMESEYASCRQLWK